MPRILVNDDVNIVLNDFDAYDMIMNKIAAGLNTLPRYLSFRTGDYPPLEAIMSSTTMNVVDILSIVTDPNAGKSFNNVLMRLGQLPHRPALDLVRDLLEPFIAYNRLFENATPENRDMFLFELVPELGSMNIQIDPLQVWNNRELIKDRISTEINMVKNVVKESLETSLDKNVKGVKYTNFELQKIKFDFDIKLSGLDLPGLFDKLKLDEDVPYAVMNNLYKFIDGFDIPSQWLDEEQSENSIIMKVRSSESKYINAILSNDENTSLFTVSIFMDWDEKKGGELSVNELQKRIMNVLHTRHTLSPSEIRQARLNGVYFIPKHSFNPNVFSDIVMNDTTFSDIMVVDERIRRRGKLLNTLNVKFENETIGTVLLSLTKKIASPDDADVQETKPHKRETVLKKVVNIFV